MRILENCEPREVLRYFEEICAIPHGSRHTKAISDYCVRFAAAEGLECHQDKSDNVIIIREASVGYEAAEPLILQGHLDMVCEKTPDCPLDMDQDGLTLALDGEWLRAEGTTLGADDGIAVAMMLALLTDRELPHPRLEALFTSDEEIGMLGAAALDPAPLRGRTLLNIDSDAEGIFTVSCAGGNVTRCRLPLCREKECGTLYSLTVGGLTGGHSGDEIDKGRAGSNELMGRMLYDLARCLPCRLIAVDGGQKDNAIPRETVAQLLTGEDEALRTFAARWQKKLRQEYRVTEPELTVRVEERSTGEPMVLTTESAARVTALLLLAPHGVQAMSADLKGLVQTSLNLGILKTEEERLSASFCVRSSLASEKEMLVDRLRALMQVLGGEMEISGDYPGWEFREDSALRRRMETIFRAQYGHEPVVKAIHAGLECGLLCGKLPGLDCVSIGPDLEDIHTPRERMNLPSVERVWKFVREVVRSSR